MILYTLRVWLTHVVQDSCVVIGQTANHGHPGSASGRVRTVGTTPPVDRAPTRRQYEELLLHLKRLESSHEHLQGDVDHLRGENERLLDALSDLEEVVDGLIPVNIAGTVNDPPLSRSPSPLPPPPPTAQMKVKKQPKFNPKAKAFYVIRKARCVGIYTS